MMTRHLLILTLAAALVAVTHHPARALVHPQYDFAVGTTFGADGLPSDGGASAALSPMWPITDHARFGVSVFADDMGSHLGHLFDPNDHTDLGLTAFTHRWAWGGAWRGDADVLRLGRWTASASGTWGWWRIEDDVRGANTAAASAVGIGLGGGIRGRVAPGQTVGLVVRWQRLFAERNASYRRVQRYATAAVEWGWAGRAPRP